MKEIISGKVRDVYEINEKELVIHLAAGNASFKIGCRRAVVELELKETK